MRFSNKLVNTICVVLLEEQVLKKPNVIVHTMGTSTGTDTYIAVKSEISRGRAILLKLKYPRLSARTSYSPIKTRIFRPIIKVLTHEKSARTNFY